MRVLQVDQYFYCLRKHSSTGKIAYKLTKVLSKHGVKVDLLTTDCDSRVKIDGCLKTYHIDTSKIYVFHVPRFLDVLRLCLPLCYNKLEEVVSNYDLIHIHEYLSPINLYVINIVVKYGIPFIIQPHGAITYPYVEEKVDFMYKTVRIVLDHLVGFKILNKAKAILTMARIEEELLRFLGIYSKFIRIFNAIDSKEYEEFNAKPPYGYFRKHLGVGKNEFLILYLGRKVPVKGLDLLIKSLHRLKQEYNITKSVKLVIAGPSRGKYEEHLKRLVKELNLENNVIFYGPIYRSLKAAAFKDADLFALVSKYETFPTVLLEAFFYETPVLATKVGVIAEDFQSLTIPVESDVEHIAKTLHDIIEAKTNLNSIARKAKSFLLKNFTYEKLALRLVKIYEQLIKG